MISTGSITSVIEVSGVHWASSKAVTGAVLAHRPGVVTVDANPVSQTATVTYDPARAGVGEPADLRCRRRRRNRRRGPSGPRGHRCEYRSGRPRGRRRASRSRREH